MSLHMYVTTVRSSYYQLGIRSVVDNTNWMNNINEQMKHKISKSNEQILFQECLGTGVAK